MDVIADTAYKFRDMDFDDRRDFFHSLPEYTHVEVGHREPISYRVILEKETHFSSEGMDEILLEIESAKLEK